MKDLLYGLLTAGSIVIGVIGATTAIYFVLSDEPLGWPIRGGLLVVYFWLSHSIMMLAHAAGVGLREEDERDKVKRDAANRLGEALG